MGHKVLISGRLIADEAVEHMRTHGMTVIASDPDHVKIPLPDLITLLEPDAIIIRTGTLDATTIRGATSLKVIAKHGVGVDMIDLDAASARGLPVMITPGANARSVAEHAMALMMCTLKDLPGLGLRTKEGQWEKATHRGFELTGKRIGLIGFGAIAQELAILLGPFDVKLTALTRREPENTGAFKDVAFTQDLSELLEASDVISLHCPLTDATRLMLGHDEFAMMKSGAFVINTARGELINEQALLAVLDTGHIQGAGLDCFATEPPIPSNKLIAHPKVIATPHIAWATHEASNNMGLITAQNIVSWLTGKPPSPAHIANYETFK